MLRATHLLIAGIVSAGIGQAQPAQPNFYARLDTQGSSCLQFGNLLVTDLNNDGIPDIVCSPVLLGNGDGTFRQGPQIDFDRADAFGYGAVADVNGDGNIDAVYPVLADGGTPFTNLVFGVSLGNGDGSFQNPLLYYSSVATNEFATYYLVVADFNGDGIPDVAEMGNPNIAIFLGRSDGLFVAGPMITLNGLDQNPIGIAAADVNRDGHVDLVVYALNAFYVFLGIGDGTFPSQLTVSTEYTGTGNGAFAIGDVTGDGIADIVINDNYSDYTFVYPGKGDGTFRSPLTVDFPGGENSSLIIADLNGDGILDLVNDNVDVAFGKGKGKFAVAAYLPTLGGPISFGGLGAAVADLRGNGRLDIVTNNEAFTSVLLNSGKGTFQDDIRTTVPGGGIVCAVTGDFNRDGVPDLVVTVGNSFQVMLGTGRALQPFSVGSVYSVSSPDCPVAGDLNGDGIVDLLVPSGPYQSAGSVVAYLGNGDGTFRQGPSSPVSYIQHFTLGDFNGDGILDYATDSNLLAYGNGDGSFGTAGPYIPHLLKQTSLSGFTALTTADLTGSGRPDIILTNQDWLLYVLYNKDGKGWEEDIVSSAACFEVYQLAVGDVNGDGKPDLVGSLDSGLAIFLNDGTGKLKAPTCLHSPQDDGNGGGIPLIADVNGDGIVDVTWANLGDAAIFLGEGAGTFAAPIYFGSGPEPEGVFALDLHGQNPKKGTPDIVEVDATGTLFTLINETK
jgi:hypothetical protein